MLVPITPHPAATPRPRWSMLPVVLLVLLLLLVGSAAISVVTRGPTPVALERRAQWRGALVAAGTSPVATPPAETLAAQNDMERLALAAARAFGVTDTLALAVMQQESGGAPGTVSPAGARGLFQVMPATGAGIAEDLGVAGYTPALLDDPAVNVRFGMYYLHKQIERFGVAWGLAAYNWGPGGVGDFLATYPAARTLSWGAVCAQYGRAIPAETQRYVTSIVAIRDRLAQTRATIPAPRAALTASAAPVAPTATGTGTVVFPIQSTQGPLTVTVVSVVRATDALTLVVRLDNAGSTLAVAPTTLRVTSARERAYTLPATWGTRVVPARGRLEVQVVCAPPPAPADDLFVTVQIAPLPPMAIAVPGAP